ncbi:rod-binding protein [Lutispora thermophila]|uniref:Flagellar protein FlgJ n=1 Tax=Lutispora thermophila DSM 19022 TaxID=1122184 RepID=A0A1M6AP34_9FIRM|nr:rod-binding protein [Lutispora thermophila]SHI38098.1 flagellar protein FlgJ [Lutispora thermophila DSM 19022]
MINPINSDYNVQIKTAVDKAKNVKDESFEDMLQKAAKENDKEEIREACRSLETVFLNIMFNSMRSTIQKSDLFGNSFARGIYEDMLYEQYAEEASRGKGLGIGEMLYEQLSKNLKVDEEV